jgi:LacI family transcriptional regulator
MAITIREVAAVAKVSPATVSRVLNGDPRVAPELVAQVQAAATRLGYQPNRQARALRTRATKVIGLLISDIQNPFFTALVRGVEDAASDRGFSVVLANTDENLAKERRYLEVALAESMAGVILSPASSSKTRINMLTDHNIPVVTLDRRIHAIVDGVTVDNERAAHDAVRHLVTAGARRIAMICGPGDVSSAADRLNGYRTAIRQAKLPLEEHLVVPGDHRIDGGFAAMRAILEMTPRPDAVFVANNLMMVGALNHLATVDVRFPEDILLAGFDEMSWCGYAPPLTLVEQPTYEIGRRAAELLLRRLSGEDFPIEHVVLEAALKVRRSSTR